MNYAVILAGGNGLRFGNPAVPKQFVELTGVPMVVYSMLTAQKNDNIHEVCVVVAEGKQKQVKSWADKYGITKLKYFANPGKERQQSVYAGLTAIPAQPRDTVIIMTSVCPFVSQKTIDQQYEKIKTSDASITVVKATDAITFSTDGKKVNRTLQKKKSIFSRVPRYSDTAL